MKISNSRDIPSSVYRLQLSSEFPIKKAIKILPYLKRLGIGCVYSSPFYDAYTSHGYDVTNPNAFNPQIGSPQEFEAYFAELKRLGLKLIIDVIPNHMGIKGGKNLWWQDVLENGPFSQYALFFDINWSPEKKELQDRILLPILENSYGEILEEQQIQLSYADGRFLFQYKDFPLPVRPSSYAQLLEFESDKLKKKLKESSSEWQTYFELIELYRFFPVVAHERIKKSSEGREKLAKLTKKSKTILAHLKRTIATYNGKKGDHTSFDLLDKLLENQFYRLSFWKVASHEINYRRFFNIHELVAIRIEEESVLEQHHRLVFHLMESRVVQGLRIDHPDGLYDPVTYFDRVRSKLPLYTVVEKILDRKEALSDFWQVEGTVGYDYLNLLNGLFIQQSHEKHLTEVYESFLGKKVVFEEILYQAKKHFAKQEMVSEVDALGLKLDNLSEGSREYRDFTRHDLTAALAEVIACFPVYRTYVSPQGEITKHDQTIMKKAIAMAKRKAAAELDVSIFDFLEKLLLIKLDVPDEAQEQYCEFVLRFQQLTAPMMAKGLEDTAFYIYNRLISLNEVGGEPLHFGHSIQNFHEFNLKKREKWPFGFLSSSTHDTKRSEDARMRLNVLSEIPSKWKEAVKNWSLLTREFKTLGPTPNAEYFIYQTLLAIWPRHSLKQVTKKSFLERVWQIILKSLRESREETSWLLNNQVYETAVRNFLFSILNGDKKNAFLEHFIPFQKEIDHFAAWNSFSATVLKIGSCGVVDVFQGNETLTYRLVDPDNRSAVDFAKLEKILHEMEKAPLDKLLSDLEKMKFYLHWKALHFRNQNKNLLLDGNYTPLEVRGTKKNCIVAFMRQYKKQTLIVLAARFFTTLTSEEWKRPIGASIWQDTEIVLPNDVHLKKLNELFTKKEIKPKGKTLLVSDVFTRLAVAYLF